MEDVKDKIEDLTTHIGDLADTAYKLAMLNLTQKASEIASGAVSAITVCVVGMFVILFGGLGLAWWLGDVVNSRAGGFLLTALFFAIVMLIFVLLRKKIVSNIRDLIIRKAYD